MPNQSLQLYPLRILTVCICFTEATAYVQLLLWLPSMSEFISHRPNAVPSMMHIQYFFHMQTSYCQTNKLQFFNLQTLASNQCIIQASHLKQKYVRTHSKHQYIF